MTTPMPPIEPPVPDDKLPGEAALAALYRQLPQNEPAPALDAAVLRAAAQALVGDKNPLAVERRRGPRERGDWVRPKELPLRDLDSIGVEPPARRRPPWLLTLGSAASLVLVAGLAWHMRELPPTAEVPAAMDRAAPAQATEAAALQRGTAPAAAMPPAEPVPPPPPQPYKPPPPKVLATSAPAPTAHALRKAAADRGTASATDKVRATGALAARAPAATPPAPVAMQQEMSSNPAPFAAETPATMAAAPAVAPVADEGTAPNAGDTPAQELDKISQLFAQGHDDEAQQRLAAFRHTHPQWELPPELRAKLRKP